MTVIVVFCWMPDQICSFYFSLTHETAHLGDQGDQFQVQVPFFTIVIKDWFKNTLLGTFKERLVSRKNAERS